MGLQMLESVMRREWGNGAHAVGQKAVGKGGILHFSCRCNSEKGGKGKQMKNDMAGFYPPLRSRKGDVQMPVIIYHSKCPNGYYRRRKKIPQARWKP